MISTIQDFYFAFLPYDILLHIVFSGKKSPLITLICFMVQNQNNIAFLNTEKLQIPNPHSFECHKKNFPQVYVVPPGFTSKQCKTTDFCVSLIQTHKLVDIHLGSRTSGIKR